MSVYLGDFAEVAFVHFAFTTNAGDGGRESTSASLEEADIVVYSSDGDGTFTGTIVGYPLRDDNTLATVPVAAEWTLTPVE